MKALVTGGAGFIGSHLVARLLAEGVSVRVLDDLSGGTRRNLGDMPVELVKGDVGQMAVVETAVAGCDLIFHLAALVSVPLSLQNPAQTMHSNVTGTFNVLEAARQHGVSRVVYASSAAVYGNDPTLPKREDSPLSLLTPYAASKQMGEALAQTYRAAYGLSPVGLRFMNVFGPRQDPSSPYSGVLSIFCRAAIGDGAVTIYGDGEQTRDFVYVADVVQALWLAGQVAETHLGETAVFNVGRGTAISLNEIVAMLGKLRERPLAVTYAAERAGDIRHSVADISRARDQLGFVPQTGVRDGLRATLDWFQQKSAA